MCPQAGHILLVLCAGTAMSSAFVQFLCHARSRTATLFALSFLVLEGRGLSRFLIKPPQVAL